MATELGWRSARAPALTSSLRNRPDRRPLSRHTQDDGQANKGRLERAFGLSKAGNYVYVACGWASRVTVVDVSDVTSPFFAGDYIDTTSGEMGYPIDVVVVGTVAYVSTWGTIVTLDVSDPTAPTRLGAVSSQTDLQGSWGIASDGIYVYVAANSNNKVAVVDVSNPASPYVAATVQDNTALVGTTGISVAGQYAFSSARAGGGFAIIDLGSYAAQVTTSGAPPGSGANGDPHIAFANGGRADFRGSHRGIYAFLSSPGYQCAVRGAPTQMPRPLPCRRISGPCTHRCARALCVAQVRPLLPDGRLLVG